MRNSLSITFLCEDKEKLQFQKKEDECVELMKHILNIILKYKYNSILIGNNETNNKINSTFGREEKNDIISEIQNLVSPIEYDSTSPGFLTNYFYS